MISSTDTRVMGTNDAPHNMAKAAMEALAYTLKERCGVLVIAMALGLVNTEIGRRMTRTLHDLADMSALDPASRSPGACQPEDVATVVGDVTRPCEVGRATLTVQAPSRLTNVIIIDREEPNMAAAGSGSSGARRTGGSRARATSAAVAPVVEEQSADDEEGRPGAERLAWLDIPRSGKISETIARDILDDIVVRQLPPGTMLASEAVMLDRYGVGRASLREALRILEIHGLIKIKPGPRGGPVVAEVTSSDLGRSATFFFHAVGATFADLLGARLAIEPLMARLAATNLTAEGAEQLKRALVDHERDASRPASSWSRTSAGFHIIVNGLSGNKVLDLLGRALLDIHASRTQTEFPVSGRGDVSRAHQRIAQAILDGDADTAEQRMRRHVQAQITNVRQTRPEMLDELIDWR